MTKRRRKIKPAGTSVPASGYLVVRGPQPATERGLIAANAYIKLIRIKFGPEPIGATLEVRHEPNILASKPGTYSIICRWRSLEAWEYASTVDKWPPFVRKGTGQMKIKRNYCVRDAEIAAYVAGLLPSEPAARPVRAST